MTSRENITTGQISYLYSLTGNIPPTPPPYPTSSNLDDVLHNGNETNLSAEFKNNLITPTYTTTISHTGISNNNDLIIHSGVNLTASADNNVNISSVNGDVKIDTPNGNVVISGSIISNVITIDPSLDTIVITDGTTTNTINQSGYTTLNTSANSTNYLNFSDSSSTGVGAIQKTAGISCNPSKSQLFASNYLANAETLNTSGTISVETRDTIITATGDYILPDGLYTGQTKNIFANTTSSLNDYKPLSTTNSLTGRGVASVNKVLKIGTDIYIGGSFTGDQTGNQNATNALKIFVKYNTLTDTYSNLTGAIIATGSVLDMVYDSANTTIYLCGTFLSVGGVANTAYIAKYNIATNTTTALSASVPNNNVSAMTLVTLGGTTILYFVGAFTQVGAVDVTKSYYCSYNTATGNYTGNLTALTSLINAQGTCIYYDPTSTKLFIGGGFTNTNRAYICYANLTTSLPASTGNINGLSSNPLNGIVGLAGSGNTGITADGSGNLYFAGGFSFAIPTTIYSANGIVKYNIAGDTYSPINIEGNFFGSNSSCEFVYYQSSANVLWFGGIFTGVGMYNPAFVTYTLNSNLPYYNNGITYFAGVNLTTNKLVWTSGKGFQQGVRSIIEYPTGTGKLLIGGNQNTGGSNAPDPLLQTLAIFDPATSGRIKITSNNSSFREPSTYSYSLNNNAKYIAITQSKSYTGLIWNGSYWITINDVKAGGITFTTNWLTGA